VTLDHQLVCAEGGTEADQDAEGWRIYRADVPQQGDTHCAASAVLSSLAAAFAPRSARAVVFCRFTPFHPGAAH
jgi:hypothetical protein